MPLLAALIDGWSSDTVETVIIGLLVLCVVGVILVLRTVQKLATRVLLVLLLVAAGGGLWLQRENLQQCRTTCTCRLFGQTVQLPDLVSVNPACGGHRQ